MNRRFCSAVVSLILLGSAIGCDSTTPLARTPLPSPGATNSPAPAPAPSTRTPSQSPGLFRPVHGGGSLAHESKCSTVLTPGSRR